jgi:acyl carrier protein
MATFDREETFRQIAALVADKLGVDQAKISMNSTLQELGADSVDLLEIIMRMEEQFGIEINDEDAEKMDHLEQVVNYIQERRTK